VRSLLPLLISTKKGNLTEKCLHFDRMPSRNMISPKVHLTLSYFPTKGVLTASNFKYNLTEKFWAFWAKTLFDRTPFSERLFE
jgi:hypothetical protein